MTTKQPDWEAIHGLYRAGLLSVRAIAERHGISDTAIRSRAKKNGWQRDLTDRVRQAAKAKVVRAEVRTSGSHPLTRTWCEPGRRPVIKSHGCQALVSTLVSRVLQWFPLATGLVVE